MVCVTECGVVEFLRSISALHGVVLLFAPNFLWYLFFTQFGVK